MTEKKLTEEVTITREVSGRIRDLVFFARSVQDRDIKAMSDKELIAAANAFWDQQHGED